MDVGSFSPLCVLSWRNERGLVMRTRALLSRLALCATVVMAALLLTPLVRSAGAAQAPRVVVPGLWSLVPSGGLAFSNGNSVYTGESCGSPTFCVAVGNQNDNQIITRWDGVTWSAMPNLPTAAPNGVFLTGVSCVTASFCMAVGNTSPSTTNSHSTYAEEWNGVQWSTVPSPSIFPIYERNSLLSVSCTSTTFCAAVGWTIKGTDTEAPLLTQWNGTTWSVDANPAGAGSTETSVESVSCVAATCEALGSVGETSQFSLGLSGSIWTVQTLPSVSGYSVLYSLSCAAPTLCMAVGARYPTGNDQSLVEQWNGSAWSVDTTPTTGFGDQLFAVDCFGPTSCVAAGSYYKVFDANIYGNEVLAWNGSTWNRQSVPSPSDSTGSQINELACVVNDICLGVGSADPGMNSVSAPIWRSGYAEVASDGGLFSFGSTFYGSMGGQALNAPIVGMAMTPDGGGYWEVASDGGLFAFGDAGFFGSMGGQPLNKPIVGMAPTSDGQGYYEVASDGGLFAFGDAVFHGSMGGQPLDAPIVGMALTPDGGGYYEVASDGGIFAFGDAVFDGSMGGQPLNKPIVGIALTNQGGYYEVASDGGLFAFGGAPFLGSMGGQTLNAPIVGMTVRPAGGYYEVASDGGLFAFGGAPFLGSMGGMPLNKPIVGIGA